MNRLTLAAGLFAAMWLFTPTVQAAELVADVPFEFQAGKYRMPAGTYHINYVSNYVLRLSTQENGRHKSVFLQTNPARRAAGSSTGSLVFNRYGAEHFLSAVWNAFSGNGVRLLQSTAERELASRIKPSGQAEVAAQRK